MPALVTLSVALPARATAGTGNPTLTTGDAPDSICPYGWRLPSGSGEKSYQNLLSNIYTLRQGYLSLAHPFGFTLAGRYNYYGGGAIDQQSAIGNYRYNTDPYFLINNGGLSPLNFRYGGSNGAGMALRCLAR